MLFSMCIEKGSVSRAYCRRRFFSLEFTIQDKKTLSDEEKEQKSLRKQIQDKLIKFATRIPIFMYLRDYREHSLKDVFRNWSRIYLLR